MSSTETTETVTAVSCWVTCSVGMLVFNKLAVTAFPLECSLVSLQLAFTALTMVVCCWNSIHIGSTRDFMRWMIVVPFFTGMLLTSMFALSNASMTTVVTFRSISPLISMAIERFYPNPLKVTSLMMGCVVCMIVGAIVYANSMASSDFGALGWLLLNNFFAIGDRLLQRLMLAKDQSPVDISKTGITFINNFFALIPLSIAALFHHEFAELPAVVGALNPADWIWVGASCIVSVGIAYTGIWAQSLVTATTFLVLINANKFFIIFLETFVMGTKHMNAQQILGASIAILSSVAYGKAREYAEKMAKDQEETTPIVAKP